MGSGSGVDTRTGGRDWSRLTTPATIALVGASEQRRYSQRFVENVHSVGHDALSLFFVNPNRDTAFGQPCYPGIAAVPRAVDAAVVSLPAPLAARVVEEGVASGVRAFVLHSAGFAEAGSEGRRLQERVQQLCDEAGAVLVGPNCMGFINRGDGVPLYGGTIPEDLPDGPVTVISQSGSSCITLMNSGRPLGFRYVVSTGNEAVCTTEDFLELALDDERTRVIALFVEHLRRPRRFLELAAEATRRGKPIVALKVGLSSKGAEVSASHTAALAHPGRVVAAAFRDTGVIQVEDLDGLVDTAAALAQQCQQAPADPDRPPGVALLSISGGELALAADLAERAGLALPPFQPATQARIAEVMGTGRRVDNPVDIGGVAGGRRTLAERLHDIVQACAEDPGVGLVAVVQDIQRRFSDEQAGYYAPIVEQLVAVATRAPVPVALVCALSGDIHPRFLALTDGSPVWVLRGLRQGMSVIAAALRVRTRIPAPPADAGGATGADLAVVPRSGPLDGEAVRQSLAGYGVDVPQEVLCTSPEGAADAAQTLGFPVVIKIASPDIVHKTDVGGVLLGVRDARAAAEGFEQVTAAARTADPGARLSGVTVTPQVAPGVELLVGLRHDPDFGPMLAVGLGGTLVELLDEVDLYLPPADLAQARQIVRSFPGSRLLEGYRGQPAADAESVARVLLALSGLARNGQQGTDVEINPLVVHAAGKGSVAVDIRVSASAT